MALGTLLATGSVECWDRLSSVRFPSITEKEAGSLFGGLAVVVLRDVRIRLLEETMFAWPMRSLTSLGLTPARSAPGVYHFRGASRHAQSSLTYAAGGRR